MTTTRFAQIVSTSLHAPERVIPNSHFDQLYGRNVSAFLQEQRNILERRHMREDERTSDLILPAAESALKKAGIKASDLDLIVVATDTPDYLSPSTAAVVQYRLGASQAGTFDVNAACAGFVTAVDVASKYIVADSKYQNVLVVGAYGMSKYLNYDDFKIATLFADGAGACVLRPSDQPGVLASELFSLGEFHDYMGLYVGGTAQLPTHTALENREHLLRFAKKIPLETNSHNWPRLTRKLLDRVRKSPEDVKLFFMTQINIQTINESLSALNLPREKSHNIMDRYGYTGSAAIGMALADADSKHLLKKGDLIILLGSGGGVSMAAMAIEWGYDS